MTQNSDKSAEALDHFIKTNTNSTELHLLRQCRSLCVYFAITPKTMAAYSEGEITSFIASYVKKHRITQGPLMDPKRVARRIRIGLQRVGQAHAEAQIPVIDIPDNIVHPLPVDKRPLRFFEETAEWCPSIHGQTPPSGQGDPITQKSAEGYRRHMLQIPTIAAMAGLEFDAETSVEDLTAPECVKIWVPELVKIYSQVSLSSFLCAAIRISKDLLGKDHPNVRALQSHNKAHRVSPSKDSHSIESARNLCRGEGAQYQISLWEIPDKMTELAESAVLRTCDINCRLSAAIAAEVLIFTLLPSADLSRINLRTDFHESASGYQLFVQHGDREVCLNLPSATKARVNKLLEFRRSNNIESEWLFCSRSPNLPQIRPSAMSSLVKYMNEIIGARIKPQDIRDAVIVNAIDTNPALIEDISDAAGYADPESAERRFAVAVQHPLVDNRTTEHDSRQ